MVHIRECMRRWLPFVIMAASLGVSPAQDVASPDAADLDLDLVKLKSGPKGRQREAMRKVLLLVHLKQKETWLAESTGDEAVHLAAEISFRRYLASVDMDGCPEEFRRAFLRYAKLLNSFEEKDLNSVADFPAVPLQAAGRELFLVLLTYRLVIMFQPRPGSCLAKAQTQIRDYPPRLSATLPIIARSLPVINWISD